MIPDKVLKNVRVREDGCWEWLRSKNSEGYGQVWYDNKLVMVHRLVAISTRTVKDTDIIRHSCHNRWCCNPDHLMVGTSADNYNDSRDKHVLAAKRRRGRRVVNGVEYSTCREVREQTGLCMSSIVKYTVDGEFDVQSYREACLLAKVVPKV
jgi:hypothetical protein